jgi:hypothetical protein
MDKFLIGNEKPKRNIQKVTYVDLSEDGEFQSHNEENESDTDPTEVTVLAKKPRKSKITQPREPKATANKGGNKIAGQTLEQHRRGFGDKIKQKIHVEKWCIEANTHCSMECDIEVFRALVAPHASKLSPSTFTNDTPVVVACIPNNASIGEIFGRSKISGGTRLGSWSANKMDIIYFPETREMRCWWTMS